MADPGSPLFCDVLRRFAASMAHSFDVNEILFELCGHVVALLDASGAGVSVVVGDTLRFVTATDERVITLERVQEEHQQGPCVEAFRTGEVFTIAAIDQFDRWPEYRDAALHLGFVAAIGLPLAIGDDRVGSLSIYDTRTRVWSDEELSAALILADIATAYLLRDGELVRSQQLNVQLQGALDSRVVIEQAKGMLARDHGVSVDDAFQLLRNHSRANNLRIREISTDVVESGLRILPAPLEIPAAP